MPRTPLADMLAEAASTAAEAHRRRIPIDEAVDERRTTRRRFLRDAGAVAAAAAGATALGPLASVARGATTGRIAIVGGGLAGLTCAYRLKQAGVNAQLYEASGRIGGRCWTRRGDFAEGQIAEHGGELIDQGHTAIRHLAQELRLPLDNQLAAEQNGTEPFYRFDGTDY